MLKFKGVHKDKPLLGFGLSKRNMELLQQDRPMLFNLAEMGVGDVYVMIVYGETEQSLMQELTRHDPIEKVNVQLGLRVVDANDVTEFIIPPHLTVLDVERALNQYMQRSG